MHKNSKFKSVSLAVFLSTMALSGCVGSSVNNALDVAVISSLEEQVSFDGTTNDTTSQLTATNSGAIPVPVRSPLSSSKTALLPDQEQSPVEMAAASVLNDTPQVSEPSVTTPAPAVAEATQLASLDTNASSLETQNLPDEETMSGPEAGSSIATPAAVQPALKAPTQPAKPKSLFELWFGKKTTQAAKPAGKTIQPTSKTVVASAVPSTSSNSSSNNSLPGVQRNSALFGINSAESDDDENSVQVASVGSLGRLMSPKGLILQTDKVQVDCFKPELLQILSVVERHYGKKVMVTSGYRSPTGNRRAGGASNSTHIYCKAADIQIEGVGKWDLAKYLRSLKGRGGVGTYCRTESVHIDVGSQRDWHHPCRRSKKKSA